MTVWKNVSLSLPGLHGRIQLVRLKEADWYWLQQVFVVPTGDTNWDGRHGRVRRAPSTPIKASLGVALFTNILPSDQLPPAFAKARRHDNEPGPGLFLAAEGSFLVSRGLS